ncbi:hypothetical protein SASPL_122252 [Salvia splendens]|uniref:GOLD domain-containing protein n=1 Tax=Salvia splendens TaxID=180675 RepID=A0A8X8XJN8_SALSN|nr:hypothetical protein SASPL_122252 [Salvia splendens]
MVRLEGANVRWWRAVLLLLACASRRSCAIWLNLPATGTKCVSDEIHNNVVVLSDFVVISDDHVHPTPTISAKLVSGSVATGNYSGTGGLSINMEWKTGIVAKDWESVARKEKIEGVELELRKLEEAVETVHEKLLYIKTRDAEMRTTNEATNYRVALFSLMSLTICILVSTLQISYLKRYFQKKS